MSQTDRMRGDESRVESVSDSASTSARCVAGYVLETRHRTNPADVEIVAEERLDCDDVGCRAFQVTARHHDTFDLEVSITCS